jgi:hypothetical protein
MAVKACGVDEAVFVNALAKGIGGNDALAAAQLERKRTRRGSPRRWRNCALRGGAGAREYLSGQDEGSFFDAVRFLPI